MYITNCIRLCLDCLLFSPFESSRRDNERCNRACIMLFNWTVSYIFIALSCLYPSTTLQCLWYVNMIASLMSICTKQRSWFINNADGNLTSPSLRTMHAKICSNALNLSFILKLWCHRFVINAVTLESVIGARRVTWRYFLVCLWSRNETSRLCVYLWRDICDVCLQQQLLIKPLHCLRRVFDLYFLFKVLMLKLPSIIRFRNSNAFKIWLLTLQNMFTCNLELLVKIFTHEYR